jgi:succinate dehydrogenase / fumarate reductase cytochrome b subunit
MSWFTRFFTSSIGQKLIMSLTGLFLISFLLVHLVGNLQLLIDDNGEAFNKYAYFMTHNKLIKLVSYGLYFFIILHAIQGVILTRKNRGARGVQYAVKKTQVIGTNRFAAKNMAALGILILVFLGIHMGDFWWAMKSHQLEVLTYGGDTEIQNLYTKVYESFKQPWIVIVYLISMAGLAFHLLHGFQSAFQTLGINHKKYTPFIRAVGKIFSIIIPILYALIPVYFYFVIA